MSRYMVYNHKSSHGTCRSDSAKLRLSCFVHALMLHNRPIAHFQPSNRQSLDTDKSCDRLSMENGASIGAHVSCHDSRRSAGIVDQSDGEKKKRRVGRRFGRLEKQKSRAVNLLQSPNSII